MNPAQQQTRCIHVLHWHDHVSVNADPVQLENRQEMIELVAELCGDRLSGAFAVWRHEDGEARDVTEDLIEAAATANLAGRFADDEPPQWVRASSAYDNWIDDCRRAA